MISGHALGSVGQATEHRHRQRGQFRAFARPLFYRDIGTIQDLRVGGSFASRMEARDGSTGFDFAGTFTRIVERELIACTFGDREMLVEFISGKDGVTVRETFDAETTHSVEQQRQGWQAILHNFAKHVAARR